MAPQVSVLLPCYNAAPTLDTALDSLAEQTFQDYEIVCVDDGSTDAARRSWPGGRGTTGASECYLDRIRGLLVRCGAGWRPAGRRSWRAWMRMTALIPTAWNYRQNIYTSIRRSTS